MDNFLTTRIKITGFGGCINAEYYTILKALRDAGFQVEEHNSSPEWVNHTPDKKYNNKVILMADHLPWGG